MPEERMERDEESKAVDVCREARAPEREVCDDILVR